MTPPKRTFYIGLFLFGSFIIQAILGIQWPWLPQLQSHKYYQLGSGLLLAVFLSAQWYLSLLRIKGKGKKAKSNYKTHQQIGTLAPLVFFLHSTNPGYAFLSLLSLVYFSNILIGLLNPAYWNGQSKRFAFNWMIAHVSLSLLTVILAGLHFLIVIYYE